MGITKGKRMLALFCALVLVTNLLVALVPGIAQARGIERTYTVNADFDEGSLDGVEHTTVPDQLQLMNETVYYPSPYLWVPNENESVSKVNVNTGKEEARYWTGPISDPVFADEGNPSSGGEPSRTTVDLKGNCWVANRYAGSALKIGLLENGQWEDRNGNGVCDTSRDGNNNGIIEPTEMLPWGQDECVLYEVILIPGKEGVFVPGSYTGGYTESFETPGPRSLAIDGTNNIWIGCYGTGKFYYVNDVTRKIEKTVEVTGHKAYGAVMSRNGILYSSGQNTNKILRMDTTVDPPAISYIDANHFVYGIALDSDGNVYASAYTDRKLSKFNKFGQLVWQIDDPDLNFARGVVCTKEGDVWVVSWPSGVGASGIVSRYGPDKTLKARYQVGVQPTGVTVDLNGKIWVCNLGNLPVASELDENIVKIDPDTGSVIKIPLLGTRGHYTYSDMTGYIAREQLRPSGTWTVIHDSGENAARWSSASWTSTETDTLSSVTVQVRAADDKQDLNSMPWITLNGDVASETEVGGVKQRVSISKLDRVPNGRYLQIKATLSIDSDQQVSSPILYDLTVSPGGYLPVANPDQKTTNEDEQLVFPASDLLANDSDHDNDSIRVTDVNAIDGQTNGTVSFDGTNVTYTPEPNYNNDQDPGNPAVFEYAITDDCEGSAKSTVSVTVISVDDPPRVDPIQENVTVDEGQEATNTGTALDIEGDNLALTASIGEVIETTPGHWSWKYITKDGPDEDQTVTITAFDGQKYGYGQFMLNERNVDPVVDKIIPSATVVPVNTEVTTRADFTDAGVLDTHTATWNWGDGRSTDGRVDEIVGTGQGTAYGNHIYTSPGVYTVEVTVYDDDGGKDNVPYQYIVVYDPSAGFVTGGGWIDSSQGAYTLDTSLSGKATFGFVSKYKKGATTPDGSTEFQFHAAGLNFHSSSYDWLVIAGAKAMYKGTGTINGDGEYCFILSATDGQVKGGDGIDRFRIKIWNKISGRVIYDNQIGDADDANASTAISGGSIVIHK
jgi:hypothetical protein